MRLGLIPAHAGKTKVIGQGYDSSWAHPRSRGENLLEGLNGVVGLGSSPLTRGKLPVGKTCAFCTRLIPAHAGKTLGAASFVVRGRAHPRSRGENLVTTGSYDGNLGSSPLTRGKPRRRPQGDEHRGLIPAHAGKT